MMSKVNQETMPWKDEYCSVLARKASPPGGEKKPQFLLAPGYDSSDYSSSLGLCKLSLPGWFPTDELPSRTTMESWTPRSRN